MVALSACFGGPELDRDKARELIDAAPQMTELRPTAELVPGGFEGGVMQGRWNADGSLRVTPDSGVVWVTQREVTLAQPYRLVVEEVTGMLEVPGTDGKAKIAEFVWTREGLPPLVRRFVLKGGTGSATFRLYDDGWRVTDIDLHAASVAFVLSDSELSEQAADFKAEQDRLQALAEQLRQAQAAFLQQAQQSVTPSGAPQVFAFQPHVHWNEATGTVRLSDVGVELESEALSSYPGIRTALYFYDAFEPARNDVAIGRPYVACPYRRGGPAITADLYHNATWGYQAYRVSMRVPCGGVDVEFSTEEQQQAFVTALRTSLAAWLDRYRDVVQVPEGYAP